MQAKDYITRVAQKCCCTDLPETFFFARCTIVEFAHKEHFYFIFPRFINLILVTIMMSQFNFIFMSFLTIFFFLVSMQCCLQFKKLC